MSSAFAAHLTRSWGHARRRGFAASPWLFFQSSTALQRPFLPVICALCSRRCTSSEMSVSVSLETRLAAFDHPLIQPAHSPFARSSDLRRALASLCPHTDGASLILHPSDRSRVCDSGPRLES